jgi:hypothetical protein
VQRFTHLRPGLERANRKTQLRLLGQRKPCVRNERDKRLGSLFHVRPSWFDVNRGCARIRTARLSTSHVVLIATPTLTAINGVKPASLRAGSPHARRQDRTKGGDEFSLVIGFSQQLKLLAFQVVPVDQFLGIPDVSNTLIPGLS